MKALADNGIKIFCIDIANGVRKDRRIFLNSVQDIIKSNDLTE